LFIVTSQSFSVHFTEPALDQVHNHRDHCRSMATNGTASASDNRSLKNAGDVRAFLARYGDVALAALVMLVVAMMVVPLPPFVLDALITLNIAAAVVLLLVSIYVSESLKIASFPTLLLLTTLFRLGLEVSATRLILLHAHAGRVIHAFGNFVVAGNLVVGVVVFVILTVVQYLVISRGSERVAEVGARFTLDALPGKQMSIDAELRSGHIDHAEARRRRALLNRESQFFGSMDGAMKFVKGDAIAAMVVLLTNIVGGLVIGVWQRGMELGVAARTFTVLTIGEGLVAQIPALIVSTAAGILVTRVSSEEEGTHLGAEVGGQILAQPRALAVAAGLLALLGVVPGLPALPFLLLALLLGFVAYRLIAHPSPAQPTATRLARPALPPPLLTPIIIELGPALAADLPPGGGRLIDELVPAVRERLFEEAGLPLPAVRLRLDGPNLPPGGYRLRLNEVVMADGEVVPGGGLALETATRLAARGLTGNGAVHPEGGAATWLPAQELPRARLSGVPTLAPEEVIAAHLLVLVRRWGFELLGIQEVQALLDALERTHPTLVREVVPKVVSPALLTDVLRRLAEEGVSLRALRDILGALAEWAPLERDPVVLTEHVRTVLRRQLTARHLGPGGALSVHLLEPAIEDAIRDAIHKTPSGSYLTLEPELSREILAAVARAVQSDPAPVLLTSTEIRRYLRRLVEIELPRVAVLSYPELSPETRLSPRGRISIAR
jgi:type III secretion protein V